MLRGFAGILRLDGAPLDESIRVVLDAMGSAIAHRGLAVRRVHLDGPIGIVVPAGLSRPLEAPREVESDAAFVAFDGRLSGEVGPSRLGSSATTEVARLYRGRGQGFVEHIEGVFALCVWDRTRGTLLLARDRIGARPLFWAVVRDAGGISYLIFGSEVKALLAHPDCPREIDWLAALVTEAMPRRTFPRATCFRDIDSLAPGTLLLADTRTGSIQPRRYWKLDRPDTVGADARTDAEIIEGYRAALERAVDVALASGAHATGILLSGGIDSVSLGALAARRTKLPTFTVLGQSTYGNGDARLAHRAAAELGLANHPVVFRSQEPMAPDAWRRLLWLSESPQCGPQHYYKFHLHRHAREAYPGLVRILNGEGSDELSGADFNNQGDDRPDATFEDYLADLADKQRENYQCFESLAVEEWVGRPVFTREFLARVSGRPLSAHPWHRRLDYVLDRLESDVLSRDDRLAAGCGLESEAPFLDARLVEYVLQIPTRAYPSLYWRKRMLRDAMKGIVPEELRLVPKIPFYGGVDSRYTLRLLYDMLMADDRALVREALGDGAHPVLAPDLVDTILQDCERDPQRGAVQVLLPLVNLGLLERMARDAAARPGPASAIQALPAVSGWDESGIAELLAVTETNAHPDVVLELARGVELVRREGPDQADPPSYLIIEDQVRYVLEGEETRSWREVLRRIDGKRPLRQILAELELEYSAVHKHLTEALEFEVLTATRGSEER